MRPALDLGRIRAHLDGLAKPPGSLGRLERLAERLCTVQGSLRPEAEPRRLSVFAADHGVVAEGVSAWPADVTALMIQTMASGGAASNVLADASRTQIEVVDVGSLAPPLEPTPGYLCRKVRAGSRNLARESALEMAEWRAAREVGAERAQAARESGCRVVAAGEMGIGNTTSASCLASLLCDLEADETVGTGAGADDETLERKRRVVARAVRAARQLAGDDPERAIAGVAGLEVAAMTGFFLEARRLGLTIVLDGFIATAAALAAERLHPGTRRAMIAAHLSAEPAHAAMLSALELEPMLDWEMRLGEGTGALLVMPLLDAAAALVGRMSSLEDLGLGQA